MAAHISTHPLHRLLESVVPRGTILLIVRDISDSGSVAREWVIRAEQMLASTRNPATKTTDLLARRATLRLFGAVSEPECLFGLSSWR